MPEPIDTILTPVAFAEMRRELTELVAARVRGWACPPERAAAHLEIPETVLAELLAGSSQAFSLDALARLSERARSAPRPSPAYGLPGRCPL